MDALSLKEIVQKNAPFSPINAGDLLDASARKLLFYEECNLYKNYLASPEIVVGRRGAGKTAFLHSAYITNNDDLIVEIDKAKVLGQVVLALEGVPLGGQMPESVAEIWESVIITLVLAEATKKYKGLKLCKDYLAKIGITNDINREVVVWNLLNTLIETQKGKTVGAIADFIGRLHNVSFFEAKKELLKYFKGKKSKAIVLIDSLESEGYILDDPNTLSAMSGLFKWVGTTNSRESQITCRICVPGEYYFSFLKLSSNRIKDFRSYTVLDWKPRELISLAGRRLLRYIELYDENLFQDVNKIDLSKPASCITLFNKFLPEMVSSSDGDKEPTLLYILRHTQLLPRHFFFILNNIFRRPLSSDRDIDEKDVINGVSESSGLLTGEVFGSHRYLYPMAEDMCYRALPMTNNIFEYGDLQRIYNHSSARKYGFEDANDFLKMLIDIGAIGKVVDKKPNYNIAQFQYNLNRQLSVHSKDKLCIHPMYRSMYPGQDHGSQTNIYPIGVETDHFLVPTLLRGNA